MPEKNTELDLEFFAGYLLRRVSSRAMSALLDMLGPLGLRITEATVLYYIAVCPQANASEIGRSLGIKRANMTPLVSRLTELGYIRITAHDGRSQGLDLTRSGRRIYEEVKTVMQAHDEIFFAMLNKKERAQLACLMKKVFQG